MKVFKVYWPSHDNCYKICSYMIFECNTTSFLVYIIREFKMDVSLDQGTNATLTSGLHHILGLCTGRVPNYCQLDSSHTNGS